jgi:hypothetical protein
MDTDDESHLLYVNFFPSKERQRIPIVEGRVSLLVMHQMAQERLANTELSYSVQVIDRYANEKMGGLEFNNNYVMPQFSKILQDKLNETRRDGRDRLVELPQSLRNELVVVIMVMPRDVARLLYRVPNELFVSLKYTITVYDGRDAMLKMRILEYMDRSINYNNALFSPFELISPVISEEIDDPLMVLFVAILDDRVVGYCGCKILRYRAEIRGRLDREVQALEKRDKNLRERYLMAEELSHVFEIKGLSVDQSNHGKNIALMLLYCAMDFMRESRVREIYHVSHITTQAASYITKRLLTTNFHFAYHGVNQFMNESFFETLGQDKKTLLMRVITEYIGYYRLLITARADTLTKMLIERPINATLLAFGSTPYLAVIRDAIHMYQLYYLLLATSVRARAYNCFSAETLEGMIGLFKLFITTIPKGVVVYTPLRGYLERNLEALYRYHTTPEIKTLDDVVYTKGPKVKDNKFICKYGFLTKPTKGEFKTIILNAYDFIYTSIANTAKLMHSLVTKHSVVVATERKTEREQMEKYLLLILGLTNALVEEDLVHQINYEIPLVQLKAIRDRITALIIMLRATVFASVIGKASDHEPRRSTIDEIGESIGRKIAFVERNYHINATITNNLFNINPRESTGFDTLISLERLSQHWPQVESVVHNRIGYTSMVILPSSEEDEDDDGATMVVEERVVLEMPESVEKRKEDMEELFHLLALDPLQGSDAFFKGRYWPVALLKEYFQELRVMEDVSSVTQEIDMVDGNAAGEEAAGMTTLFCVYQYDDFSQLMDELGENSRFNTEGGFI